MKKIVTGILAFLVMASAATVMAGVSPDVTAKVAGIVEDTYTLDFRSMQKHLNALRGNYSPEAFDTAVRYAGLVAGDVTGDRLITTAKAGKAQVSGQGKDGSVELSFPLAIKAQSADSEKTSSFLVTAEAMPGGDGRVIITRLGIRAE